MCIIIHKPEGRFISTETLYNCYMGNRDGIGLLFAEQGELKIYKTLSYESFLKRYEKLEERELLIHFRYATHGTINVRNCHGFRLNKHLAFVHNGIISIDIPKGRDITDSEQFGNEYLKPLPKGFETNPAIKKLIENRIKGSKIALMDSSGKVTIYNKQDGITEGGVWYSNLGFRSYKQPMWEYVSQWSKEDEEESIFWSDERCSICGDVLTIREAKKKHKNGKKYCFSCEVEFRNQR